MPSRTQYSIGLLCFAVMTVMASVGHAQSKTADPGRIQERIKRPQPEKPETDPSTKKTIEADPEDQVKGTDEVQRFALAGVTFANLSVFTAADFAPYYEPYLATEIGLEEVKSIAQNVTDHYRTRGFFLARAVVEPQSLAFGILTIRLVEGSLQEVRFPDADPKLEAMLRPYTDKIMAQEGPANINLIERYLLLMSDLPGVEAKGNVDPIDREKGIYALRINAKRKAVSGYLSFDNRGTRAIGRDEAYATLSANGLFSDRGRTGIGVFTVPSSPKELGYVEFNQSWAVGTEGTTISTGASHSQIDAGADEEDNNLNSRSTRFFAEVRHPYIRRQKENLNFYGTLNVGHQRQNDFGVLDYDDRLQVLRLGSDYYLEDDLRGFNFGTLWISRGLSIHDRDTDTPQRSRDAGRPVFTKAYARAERRQMITDNWAVKVSAAGQVSDQRLLSNEEFSLGGTLYGRGYDGGEISGTHGAAGSFELQYGDNLSEQVLTSYQFYGFYDGGVVWETSANSYASQHESLASAGIGVRVGFIDKINGGLEVAKPLTRPADNAGGTGKDPRIFFYLNGNF